MEFVVQVKDVRAGWYQQYLSVIGGWPVEEEGPAVEQVPVLCAYFTSTGYVTKELPGHSTFAQNGGHHSGY